jgi:hypothetical protein
MRYDRTQVDPRLLQATEPLIGKEPNFTDYHVTGADDLVTELAPDIIAFPFLSSQWCARCIAMADLVDAYSRVASDRNYAAMEVRLSAIAPAMARAFHVTLLHHVLPIGFHFWKVYLNKIHPPFVTRYTMDTQTGMDLHHDNISDVTLSVVLNDAFEGGGLYFERQDYSARGLAPGTAILFPGKVTHRHGALNIRSGKRYVITTWMQQENA